MTAQVVVTVDPAAADEVDEPQDVTETGDAREPGDVTDPGGENVADVLPELGPGIDLRTVPLALVLVGSGALALVLRRRQV